MMDLLISPCGAVLTIMEEILETSFDLNAFLYDYVCLSLATISLSKINFLLVSWSRSLNLPLKVGQGGLLAVLGRLQSPLHRSV